MSPRIPVTSYKRAFSGVISKGAARKHIERMYDGRLEQVLGLLWAILEAPNCDASLKVSVDKAVSDISVVLAVDSDLFHTSTADFAVEQLRIAFVELNTQERSSKAESRNTCYLAIGHLNRLLAGSAIKNGLALQLDCASEHGCIRFPNTRYVLSVKAGKGMHSIRLTRNFVIVNDRKMKISDLEKIPVIRIGGRDVQLTLEEPAHKKWIQEQPFNAGLNAHATQERNLSLWTENGQSAATILNKCWPEISQQIGELIVDIVPIAPESSQKSLSCSSSRLIGAVMASPVPGLEMGEMLVHEYSHNLLNSILRVNGLGSDQTIDGLYSPFRPDPRPFEGIVHAMFSFSYVACYYGRIGTEPRFERLACSRYSEIVLKLRVCLASAKSQRALSKQGVVLLNALERQINRLYAHPLAKITVEMIAAEAERVRQFEKSQGGATSEYSLKSVKRQLQELRSSAFEASSANIDVASSKSVATVIKARIRSGQFLRTTPNTPRILCGMHLFKDGFLTKTAIRKTYASQRVTQINSARHLGHRTTPRTEMTLGSYIENLRASERGFGYLGEQRIGQWRGVATAVVPKILLRNFFFDNEELLLFVNAKGTRVRLHYDSANNLHFNLWGRKEFLLFPPEVADSVYEASLGYNHGFSPIDPFSEKLNDFPKFKKLKGQTIILNQGDCLYIPEGWWHGVQYLEDCGSVTCFDRYMSSTA